MTDKQLPPLPERLCIDYDKAEFSADQMREYALQAIAHATQPAELMDADIEQALVLAHAYADAKLMRYGMLGIEVSPDPDAAFQELRRAILALRPVQVPMTEDQVWHNDALMSANGIAGFKMDALMRIVRAVEAHHFGITAQAKKEAP